jgi:antitoxin component of RelBE/YafQ-DinJ toxin-antitoxin module
MFKSLLSDGGFSIHLGLTIYIPLYTLLYMKTLDKTVMNIKLSKSLKQDAQALADEIGVPLSTVVIANLKEFVRSRSLNISALPRLKPEIEKELGEAIADYKSGKNISKTFSDVESLTEHLRSL